MAVTASSELRETGKATSTPTSREYVRVLMIDVNDRSDDAVTVETWLDANGFTFGSAHGSYAAATLYQRDITRVGDVSSFHWRVELTYRTEDVNFPTDTNPLTRDPVVRWGTMVETRTLSKDYTATPKFFVNTAGAPYENPPQALFATWELSYTRNEANLNDIFDMVQQDTTHGNSAFVNSATFTIDGQSIGVRKALMWVESAVKMTEGSTTYYQITYRFLFKIGATWRPSIAQYGYIYKDGSGNYYDVPTYNGAPVSRPWPLDANGNKQATFLTDPAEVEYIMYKEITFAPFGFT